MPRVGRIAVLAAGLTTSALVLAGCGAGGKSSSPPTTSPPPSTNETSTAAKPVSSNSPVNLADLVAKVRSGV